MKLGFRLVAATVAAFGLAAGAAQAEDFYAGKTIDLVVPSSAAGSYSIYARLIAESLPKHIPGNPTIVPQYMGGAGGMRASNQVANTMANDGTVLYVMHQNAPSQQLLDPDQVSYDAAKFIPIGTASALNSAMAIRKDAPASDLEGFKEKEVILGTTGRGSYQFVVPTLMNQFQGTKFKLITTYPGTGETMLAVDQGEIHGMLSSFLTLQQSRPNWTDGSGDAKIVFQIGVKPDPAIPDVPLLTDLATSDEERQLYRFMSLGNRIARSFVFPAGVPQDRVDIMRKAFEEMLQDEEFKELAKRTGAPLDSGDWQELGSLIAEILATPPAVYEVAQKYMTEQ